MTLQMTMQLEMTQLMTDDSSKTMDCETPGLDLICMLAAVGTLDLVGVHHSFH